MILEIKTVKVFSIKKSFIFGLLNWGMEMCSGCENNPSRADGENLKIS
jgi:hypothetical protein